MIFRDPAHRKTGLQLILCTWLLYSAQACVMPHLTRYYDLDLKLDDWQIGMLMAFPALLVMFAQPLWGVIADRYLGRTRTFRLILVLGVMSISFFAFAFHIGGFALLMIAALLMRTCFGSTTPIHSSIVLSFLGKERGAYFGRIRVFGSLSFMLTMFILCPWIVHWSNLLGFAGRELLFLVTATFFVLTLLTTFWDETQFDPQTRPELKSFFALGQNPKIIVLYISLFLTSIGASGGIQYIGPYVGYRGFSEFFYSSLWFSGVAVEVLITYNLHLVIKRVGIKKTIAFGLLCEGIRWLGIWYFDSHYMILFFFALHGVSVSALFFASAMFVDRECDSSIRSTGQSMLFFSIILGQVTGFLGGSLLVGAFDSIERVDAIRAALLWFGVFGVLGSLVFASMIPRKVEEIIE